MLFKAKSRVFPSKVKSRRGAPKRIPTDGFACPNQQCPYFGITDASIHAPVGDGKHGQAERIQTFRCQACRSRYLPEKQVRDNPHIPPPQPHSLMPEQKYEAAALLRQGWSIRQVASHYGVSRGSIHRLAEKEGIELHPTLPKLAGEKQEEALALLKQGFSLRQVAKRLGVHHETVRGLVKRLEGEQE